MSFVRGIPLDPGSEHDKLSIPLGTRKRTFIKNQIRNEWAPEDLQAGIDNCRQTNPNVEVRSVTAVYNCVGMVFASRRTWVEPDYIPQILEEDGYQLLPGLFEKAEIGDVVVYKKSGQIEHVGIIIEKIENPADASVSFKVLSKWGPWAEYIHDPHDVLPGFGEPTEVWTDRKQPR
jgi:hypothetical protein